jgi:hypothetical protein
MSVTVMLIVGCLQSSAIQCKTFRTELAENISTTQCFMNGPIEVQKWSEQNPGWVFKRLTCKPDDGTKEDKEI